MRTEEGKCETTVYRKKSASDRYIHFTSSQAWKEKACAIRMLKSRAANCSTDALFTDELSHLLQVFMGYPERTVWRLLYEKSRKPHGHLKVCFISHTIQELAWPTPNFKRNMESLQCTKRLKHLGITF